MGFIKIYRIVFILALFFTGTGQLLADGIALRQKGENKLEVIRNTADQLILLNSIAEINALKVQTEAGIFVQLGIPGYSYTEVTGEPQLPVNRRLIEVPAGSTPHVEIVSYAVEEYSLPGLGIQFPVFPDQPPCPKSSSTLPPFEYKITVYQQDDFWGQELVTVDVLGVLRGVRLGRVNICPFAYNPVKQILRVYHDLRVEITFPNADMAKTEQLKSLMENPYFRSVGNSLLNHKPFTRTDTIAQVPVKYVIVSDPMFQEQLQPFAEWKTKKGFQVMEAYTDDPLVGTTTASIKAFLQGLYEAGTTADPAPSFVLFVGDVAQVPAWNLSGESDREYCEYTGDLFPEVYYGRFSATNPDQLQPQIDKTLMYEQFTMPDPSYLGEVVMIGGMDGSFGHDWANGQITYGTENYFNEAHGILSHTYLYPNSGPSEDQIRQDISNGVAYANYTAHGSPSGWANPSFSTSDIASLQNEGKYGLLVGNACSTSEFATSACFAEEMLRAVDKGSIGYIGGSNSTYWDEDYYWGVGVGPISEDPPAYEETSLGAYDRMFHDHGENISDWYTTQDQMIYAGNLAVTEGSPSMAEYYWDIYNLMGDPSLTPYLGVPATLAVTYDQLMPLASTSFTITAEPNAYVAISRDNVLHGSAFANEEGVAVVTLTPITVPGTADVVVTAQNRQPHIGTVVVASPEGPYILMNAFQVNDATGNGNQLADYGEDVRLNITLKNVGSSDASNLTATLTTDDPFVDITEGVFNWPDIQSDSVSGQENVFMIHVQDSIPDLHKAVFTLELSDGSETWTSPIQFLIHAPLFIPGNYIIVDDIYGNGNGNLDAGEVADLYCEITNGGHASSGQVIAGMNCENEFIFLNSFTDQLTTIAAGETHQAHFTLTVDPAAPIGNVATFGLQITSDPYAAERSYQLKIGKISEDFETADFEAFNWALGGDAEWQVQEGGYSGNFCARSGAITHLQETVLMITIDVLTDDSIKFYRKVSSESGYDFLKFYIDGFMKAGWSGNQDWELVSFPVSQGTRTFRWIYSKDTYASSGSDCGWIDLIEFPAMATDPGPFSLYAFANPQQICQGSSAMLFAIPSGGTGTYSYAWEPSSSLNDPTIFNPLASPIDETEYTVTVTDGQETLSAEITVSLKPRPEAPSISQVDQMLVSSASEGNQWYREGVLIEGATGQSLLPPNTGEYWVTVTGDNGCESEPSNTIYYMYTSLGEPARSNTLEIYPNPFSELVQFRYALEEASPVRIRVYNLNGETVRILLNGEKMDKGTHTVTLSAEGLEPGVYYCRFESAGHIEVRKIILAK
ncbi:MAG TPA: C25 family cysteine peptidase [Bacteroidales bacterium]|nr:C25 family cysteine peptidase [Bacteroidales bacterium]